MSEAGLRNHHVSNTAYPLAHGTTWAPYRVPRARMSETLVRGWEGVRELGLYAHIPFCEVRCSFCEYTVVGRPESGEDRAAAYVDALLREIDLVGGLLGTADRVAGGLDIGGGTPSFVDPRHIGRILDALRARYAFGPGADVSIETTPRIAAAEPGKMRAYRAMGIDRISMGIQVADPALLKVLHREGNGAEHHARAMGSLRAAGFDRVNVDLLYGLAGQTPEGWEATLAHAVDLGPEYVTLYRMRYKLTRISRQAPSVALDQVRVLHRIAGEVLRAAGYEANPGKTTFSRIPGDVGTSSYLARRVTEGMPYLGFGLGAQGFSRTTISYNDGAAGKNLGPYLGSVVAGRIPVQDLYDLPPCQAMAKMCSVSFYFGEIDHGAFERRFGVPFAEEFAPEIDFLLRKGWMEWSSRTFRLTKEGAPWTSGIIPLFWAPATQRYLLDRNPDDPGDMDRNRSAALRVAAGSDPLPEGIPG
ncbi:MAG: coproporphyrinogen III oxidase family protein [Planctomycetes bacterium]|nr:coproporphyrinogen III oxidase family protein [Planctomycetota bacterium]